MNVFVLCTGRCGSKTFATACKHIDNYSAAHESRTDSIGEKRLAYPDQHIEVDNRLSWFLGPLDEKFGERAFYVHLLRDNRATARSFEKRYGKGIIRAYAEDILEGKLTETYDPYDVCLDYCLTLNSNIRAFLRNKPYQMTVTLDNIATDFHKFWHAIEARGDLNAALEELEIRHNKSAESSPGGFAKIRKFLGAIGKEYF